MEVEVLRVPVSMIAAAFEGVDGLVLMPVALLEAPRMLGSTLTVEFEAQQ